MIIYIFLSGVFLFILAYIIYGNILVKKFNLSNDIPTPAKTICDNVDYCPTKTPVLFGHHFSSIAGAGPIVGPIIAGLMFGWLPALIWIILGSIFIGGVHDFTSIVGSIRNKGKSIAEIIKQYMGKNLYHIMLIFIWLTLVYVLIVFLDLAATTFTQKGEVASVSILYILLAIIFGIILYRLKSKLSNTTILFVIILFLGIYLSDLFPIQLPGLFLGNTKKTWSILLIVYMYFASTLPVWILLQPRDYLSSFLLYASVLAGTVGIIFGGFAIQYPALTQFTINNQTLFPILFVTIACGAVSGFHSLVASGTTSKQLEKETDAKIIGYGGMLTEGVVALISLATVMMIAQNSSTSKLNSISLYANGIGNFVSILGINKQLGETFGLLVLSAFVLTTLDTATRIARYILQELFNWDIKKTRFIATGITIILPFIFAVIDIKDAQGKIIPAYQAIWPVFGASNQLLAALVLLVISVWLVKSNKKALFTALPMLFMLIVTLTALFQLILIYQLTAVGIIAILLFVLSLYFIISSLPILKLIFIKKQL